MRVRQTLAIATMFLRRAAINPMSLAGIFLLPILIALIFGAADEKALSQMPIGVYMATNNAAGTHFVAEIDGESGVVVHRYSSREALDRAVRRADIVAGVDLEDPAQRVTLIGSDTDPIFGAARAVVLSVAARGSVAPVPADAVHVTKLSSTKKARESGRPRAAAGMLVFFVFVNACFASAYLTEDRARGVLQRTASGPVPLNAIIGGEMFGRFLFAIVQGALVALVSSIVLDATWGAVWLFALVLAAVSCVAAGVSVLLGVLIRRPGPEAATVSLAIAAILGFLGGCFWSLSFVPALMRWLALITPHAWALRAIDSMVARGGGIADVGLDLVMLMLFAVAVLFLAAFGLRRSVLAAEGAR